MDFLDWFTDLWIWAETTDVFEEDEIPFKEYEEVVWNGL
jgi:hypothetical protein